MSTAPPPEPPYSSGIATPSQPSSAIRSYSSWLWGSRAALGQRVALLARPALAAGEVADRLDERALLVGQGRASPARDYSCGRCSIRHADPRRDAAACAAIYAPYVRDTAISLEEVPPTPSRWADRIEPHHERYPWLVAEDDGAVAGFAYARAAPRARRLPLGDRRDRLRRAAPPPPRDRPGALPALFGLLARQGVHVACAGITLPNDGQRRPARVARVPPGGRLPADRLEARRLARRRLVAAAARRAERRAPGRARAAGAPDRPGG